MNIEEDELIRKSRIGDNWAFETLTKRYYTRIKRHCYSIIGDAEKSEDLVQETFLKAYNHLDQFEERSSFYTWLWKIAHNLSLNALKKKEIEFVQLNESITPTKTKEENCDIPFHIFEKVLTKKQQEVFLLYFKEHLSQKEIAYRLNIPHGTVRSRLYSGKQKLKNYFNTIRSK